MQELGKSNFNKCQIKWIGKINFNINNKLAFISMVEESKYCSDVIKKHFNKELAIT